MKLALLMSNGETVALASRLTVVGASARIAALESPLPECDFFLFDESAPLSSSEGRAGTRKILTDALASRVPSMAILTENAPVSPRCALVMSEMIGYASAAVMTPQAARDILGLEGIEEDTALAEAFADAFEVHAAALAKDLLESYELSFSMIFDPEENRGILYSGDAYDKIKAETLENAVAELFRTA